MRRLFLALALLILPSVAMGQSDTRKVALFYPQGGMGYGGGGYSETYIQQARVTITRMLDRMGVPYDEFMFPDSASWGSDGVADSTWFREQGYLGIIFAHYWIRPFDTASYSYEVYKYFKDEAGTVNWNTSPIGGQWSIPVVSMFRNHRDNLMAGQGAAGSWAEASGGGASIVEGVFHDNDDSTSVGSTNFQQINPAESANVDIVIGQDQADPDTTGQMLAWTYKDNLLWIGDGQAVNGFGRVLFPVYAVSWLFTEASYTPARRMSLHATIDHPLPRSPGALAETDSIVAYVNAMSWPINLAWRCHEWEQTEPDYFLGTADSSRTFDVDAMGYLDHFKTAGWFTDGYATPHAHIAGICDYALRRGNPWYDLTAFTDTATVRDNFNRAIAAITDTLGLTYAQGYQRCFSPPTNVMRYKYLYIMGENGIYDLRANADDSLGVQPAVNLHSATQIIHSATDDPNGNWRRPFSWYDHKSGKVITFHELRSTIAPYDTTTTLANYAWYDDLNGKTAGFIDGGLLAAINDMDWYWHHETNIGTDDNYYKIFMRRFMYVYNRVSNIVELSDHYTPRTPRRSFGTR